MGNQLTTPMKTLIGVGFIMLFYIIGIIAYFSIKNSGTSTQAPTLPSFTSSPTSKPITTLEPTSPSTTSDPTTSSTVSPHLDFDNASLQGPPGFGPDFYRLGCQAAISEGLFPFTSFDTTGTYKTGTLCNYYTYDTWGFGGDTNQLNCGGNCISGTKTTCSDISPPISPNQPWSDEQCGICATASKDPNCIWTRSSDSCYKSDNVSYVPSYRGMDISQCYYKEKGNFNDTKLCCNPSVA